GALLPGAGFTFDLNPFTGVATPIQIDDGGASDKADSNDGLLCIDHVRKGTYHVKIGRASCRERVELQNVTVTVKEKSTCSANSIVQAQDAIRNSKLSAVLTKTLEVDGALLPGAGFTFDVNPFTGVATPIQIDDGGASDKADSNDGLLCIDHVRKGTYHV